MAKFDLLFMYCTLKEMRKSDKKGVKEITTCGIEYHLPTLVDTSNLTFLNIFRFSLLIYVVVTLTLADVLYLVKDGHNYTV